MTGNKPSVCAVAVAYRNVDELRNLLESLARQERPLDGVIVVDNSDDEAHVEANREFFLRATAGVPYADFFAVPGNVGSAGGFKLGMERAHMQNFDWVWLLDQDGTAAPDCLDALLAGGAPGIRCPVVLPHPGGEALADFRCAVNALGGIAPIPGERQLAGTQKIDLAGTHGILVHRDVIGRIGVFDGEGFFVGGEDFDYCLRAGRAGFEVWLISEAHVYHPDLSVKAGLSGRARLLRGLAHKLAAFMPQFLGFLRGDRDSLQFKRRRVMIAFNKVRLNRFQRLLALSYSVPVLFFLKLAGVDLMLGESLTLYFAPEEPQA